MIAAMATAGFLGYYVAGSVLSEDSHVRSFVDRCRDGVKGLDPCRLPTPFSSPHDAILSTPPTRFSHARHGTQRMMVGTVTAMGMLMVEMVLYIIRTTELECYQPKRQRNEEMGRKGLQIPTGDPLDDMKWRRLAVTGGRTQQRQLAASVLVAKGQQQGGADSGSSDTTVSSAQGTEEAETAPLITKGKDKDV